MFGPDMMAAAQKMMSNMKPEDMQRMSQMAANMDPKMMENMMKGMGGPAANVDTAQAVEQMKNMTPEQMQQGMAQAQGQVNAQRGYLVNAATMLKNEGNVEVKSENYQEALTKYNKALENTEAYSGADVASLRLGLLNNVALCHLKRKDFDKAIEAGDRALALDSQSFKALFRRGQAHEALGLYGDALADLGRASEIAPSDKAISRELDRLQNDLQAKGIDANSLKPTKVSTSSPSSVASNLRETTPSSRAAGSSDQWAQAAEKMAENPEILKEATEKMSKLTPQELDAMIGSSPLPPGVDPQFMRSQMEHLQKNPDLMKDAMDKLNAISPEERKRMLAGQASAAGAAMPDVGRAAAMFDNPDMMQQAVEMTKNMGPEEMKRLNINSTEEADMMRKAAEQMAANPELTKSMTDMMKNMPPEQLQSMMDMSARMRGGGDRSGGAGGAADMDPSALLSDPDMMKATEEMMKNMSPETLASMARASGLDMSEDKAQVVAKFLPYMLKLMRCFTYLKKLWSAMWSPSGRIAVAVVIVLLAVLQHFRSS